MKIYAITPVEKPVSKLAKIAKKEKMTKNSGHLLLLLVVFSLAIFNSDPQPPHQPAPGEEEDVEYPFWH